MWLQTLFLLLNFLIINTSQFHLVENCRWKLSEEICDVRNSNNTDINKSFVNGSSGDHCVLSQTSICGCSRGMVRKPFKRQCEPSRVQKIEKSVNCDAHPECMFSWSTWSECGEFQPIFEFVAVDNKLCRRHFGKQYRVSKNIQCPERPRYETTYVQNGSDCFQYRKCRTESCFLKTNNETRPITKHNALLDRVLYELIHLIPIPRNRTSERRRKIYYDKSYYFGSHTTSFIVTSIFMVMILFIILMFIRIKHSLKTSGRSTNSNRCFGMFQFLRRCFGCQTTRNLERNPRVLDESIQQENRVNYLLPEFYYDLPPEARFKLPSYNSVIHLGPPPPIDAEDEPQRSTNTNPPPEARNL